MGHTTAQEQRFQAAHSMEDNLMLILQSALIALDPSQAGVKFGAVEPDPCAIFMGVMHTSLSVHSATVGFRSSEVHTANTLKIKSFKGTGAPHWFTISKRDTCFERNVTN